MYEARIPWDGGGGSKMYRSRDDPKFFLFFNSETED